MPGVEIEPVQALPQRTITLSGWGHTHPARCRVLRADSVEALAAAMRTARATNGVIARGAGRSYGDAAQNDGGLVLDMTTLSRILWLDVERREVHAQAGVHLSELLRHLAAASLTLPVVPGTQHVTLGGAIASDIHGKNHHRDGSIARYVRALSLCLASGEILELSADRDGELFYATIGGMGLTGTIVEATIAVEPLPVPWVSVDTTRTSGLAETLARMAETETHRYSVAWMDLLARGRRAGRAVISRGESMSGPPSSRRARESGARSFREPLLDVPRRFPGSLLRPETARAFNAVKWARAPRRETGRETRLDPFFFPLDVLGEWHRLYGRGGLLQYQLAIPDGAEDALERCFSIIGERRLPVYLAVFKRFGQQFGGPLSFPLAGWTLAIDLPAEAEGLRDGLRALDDVVAAAGGRVYLTKDSRLSAEMLRAMYPRLDDFLSVRERVDPDGMLRSDLAVRLGLCEPR